MHIEFEETQPVVDPRIAGFRCKCCGQYCKIYTRKINSSMAAVLLLLWKHAKTDYIHVENFLKSINKAHLRADFHKLVWWTLLERKKELREDSSPRNGFYKITGRGMAFAANALTVPKAVKIYNNQFQGFEGEEINILDALGTKFSYADLMQE